MTDNTEERLKRMLAEAETSKDKLRDIVSRLRLFYDRLETIAAQHKRRLPMRDTTFEPEFRATVEELKNLTNTSEDFWQQARRDYHISDKGQMIADNRVTIKQINIAALAFTRQTDELFTLFKNLQTLGKEVPLRLNWWILEYCCEDLFKITNRILFMVRDMEKHYD